MTHLAPLSGSLYAQSHYRRLPKRPVFQTLRFGENSHLASGCPFSARIGTRPPPRVDRGGTIRARRRIRVTATADWWATSRSSTRLHITLASDKQYNIVQQSRDGGPGRDARYFVGRAAVIT